MNNIKFDVYLNTLRKEGNLAYEYNPFYNYQTDVDLYIIDDKYIVPDNKRINIKNGEILSSKTIFVSIDDTHVDTKKVWIDKHNNIIEEKDTRGPDYLNGSTVELWASAGSLVDMDTDLLNFDLEHPVDIEVQPSYDGSVNLILNDDKNTPRLINSRFSVREKDTYEIVDRIGENDTNIYNSKTFDKDVSLYFLYESNPTITYLGLIKGILPVGLYCFYFTYCDADDNESDIIAETGVIPVFIGNDKDPSSMDGGIKNQSSEKGITLRLSNIDNSYNYLKVYYVRYYADYQLNRVLECKEIIKKYSVNNTNLFYLQITGNEQTLDIDANILNVSKFNPKSVLTLTLCKNMLFFGNIVKNSDNYRELSDIALRIIPSLDKTSIGKINSNYGTDDGDYAYYNTMNIYNKTGYFNQEYYRFGVVFIYENGALSNVYNTLGGTLYPSDYNNNPDIINPKNNNTTAPLYTTRDGAVLYRNYIKIDDNGWVKNANDETYEIKGENINSKGVCFINYTKDYSDTDVFSIKFKVSNEIQKCLKEDLGIRGFFFVRQKCTPNIIALCYLLAIDKLLETPILEVQSGSNKMYYTESFVDNTGKLSNDYYSRLYTYQYLDKADPHYGISFKAYAGICPDFLLNLPFYNQIFNGAKFKLLKISKNSELVRAGRIFYENSNVTYNSYNNNFKKVSICSVTEAVPTVAIKDSIFKLEVGVAEEAYKYKFAEIDKSDNINDIKNNGEIKNVFVRGKYSPYLAIYSEEGDLETGCLYNIYLDLSLSDRQEYQNRMNSNEPFYAISDRYSVINDNVEYTCYRGDCYINLFTYRLNRNFNDPSLPNNDTIITPDTWDNNIFTTGSDKLDEWKKISRSDVNAVQLGSWITFKVRSSMNYALRSVDHSYVSEEALMGAPRSFYPRTLLFERGENKLPESYLYNDAFKASLGFKCYFTLEDVNYIKDTFSNRIQYSSIAIQDSFKNNYRDSLSTYFRDYSSEYGSITRLIGFEGYILVVFEHGIGIAVVNERILAGEGDGEPVFINTKNVLPEELTIISDTYGTQWSESVVKSEAGYVYGVDTIAKKIWRVKGQEIEIISDLKVNGFLSDNITLGERELTPIIGLKNVKTHYNNNKKDIMFTFYDDIYKDEEKVWNLCYNELLGEFVTFYSWIPSYSANIDTKFFTFNRDTSKCLSLLAKSNYNIANNYGVLIDSPIIDYSLSENISLYYVIQDKSKILNYTVKNLDGTTSQKSINIDAKKNSRGLYVIDSRVKFKLENDHWGNHNLFEIDNSTNQLSAKDKSLVISILSDKNNKSYLKVIILYITPYIQESSSTVINFRTESIALTLAETIKNPLLTSEEKNRAGLTTDFYLHGKSGIFDVAENLYPTYWYGEYHPFEFEFVVTESLGQLKIFNNLIIISNKAEPESFHFEIEGDNYEFSSDKRTMYFRLEETKELYLNLGSNILFNRYYKDICADKYTQELYYRGTEEYTNQYSKLDKVYPVESLNLVQLKKSTIFPLYYEKVDTYNDVYHKYHLMKDEDGMYDFLNLSGSEISWNRTLNLFNIVTHIKNNPIDRVGRIRGNSFYKEGKWNVQIPSINFMLKNELPWDIPPIIINSEYLPNDITNSQISRDVLPNIIRKTDDIHKYVLFSNDGWTNRKSTRIRDKWIKIRVRYSGKNLAVIHSLVTLYNLSYS